MTQSTLADAARDGRGDVPPPDQRAVRRRRSGNGLASVGRVALWAFVGLVLVRGLGTILGGSDGADRGSLSAAQESRFPDDEARAFALRFTHAFLGGTSQRPDRYRRAVASFFAEDVRDQTAALLPSRGPGAKVAWATVARESALGRFRALITVAAASDGVVRYLSVPIARDRAGGLVVTDLPALSAPPPLGAVDVPEPVTLPDAQARPITDLVTRFLTAYVGGGDRAALGYFVAPGTRLVQMAAGLDVVAVEQVARDPQPVGDGLAVVALVRSRDRASGAEFVLRYRLAVIRRERWYVRAVAGGPSS